MGGPLMLVRRRVPRPLEEEVRSLRGSCVSMCDAGYAWSFPPSSAGRTIPPSAARMRRLSELRLRGGLPGRSLAALGLRPGLARVLGDELLGRVARLVVGALVVRRLHEVRARAVELAADAVVERQLQAAHGV